MAGWYCSFKMKIVIYDTQSSSTCCTMHAHSILRSLEYDHFVVTTLKCSYTIHKTRTHHNTISWPHCTSPDLVLLATIKWIKFQHKCKTRNKSGKFFLRVSERSRERSHSSTSNFANVCEVSWYISALRRCAHNVERMGKLEVQTHHPSATTNTNHTINWDLCCALCCYCRPYWS